MSSIFINILFTIPYESFRTGLTVCKYIDAYEFVKGFKMETLFKKIYNKTIEEWNKNNFISDEEIISEILDKLPEKYLYIYNDDNLGSFSIFKIEE